MLLDNNQIGWAYVSSEGEVYEIDSITPTVVLRNNCGQEIFGLFKDQLGGVVVLLPFSKEQKKVIIDESTLYNIRELNCFGSFVIDGEQVPINWFCRNFSGLEGITRLIEENKGLMHNISNTQECGRGL